MSPLYGIDFLYKSLTFFTGDGIRSFWNGPIFEIVLIIQYLVYTGFTIFVQGRVKFQAFTGTKNPHDYFAPDFS